MKYRSFVNRPHLMGKRPFSAIIRGQGGGQAKTFSTGLSVS
jgi:hypothetical protein